MTPLLALLLFFASTSSLVYLSPRQTSGATRLRLGYSSAPVPEHDDITQYADWVVGRLFTDIMKSNLASDPTPWSVPLIEASEETRLVGERMAELMMPHITEDLRDSHLLKQFFRNVGADTDLLPPIANMKNIVAQYMISRAVNEWISEEDGLEDIARLLGDIDSFDFSDSLDM